MFEDESRKILVKKQDVEGKRKECTEEAKGTGLAQSP
jgi:hypothetical protein